MSKRAAVFSILVMATASLVACAGPEVTTRAQPRLSPELVETTPAPTITPTRALAVEPNGESTPVPTAEPTKQPTEEPASNCEIGFEGDTITVYQQGRLSGPAARFLDNGFVNGAKDAVSAVNNRGGVCGAVLELRLEDTQYNPERELEVYEQYLIEEPKPMFVLTHGDEATAVLKERVIEDEILNITTGLDAETLYLP